MTKSKQTARAPARNFYGRRHGKTMNAVLKDLLRDDLASRTVGLVSWDDNPDRVPLDMAALFGDKPVWLEVGFGSGEHLAHQAQANPSVEFIGCEPFINGVATLLGKLQHGDISNVSILPDDVRDLFDVLPDASIDKAFLLYPDPWPKSRHHRRRFVTPDHLKPLARVLRQGAEFRVATDIPGYVRQTLQEVPGCGFELLDTNGPDQHIPWPDWISTRYEAKALREGRTPHYLTFRKL